MVPVPVFPSHCFKWGLLLSTATRLLGLEGKQHRPDAAGTGSPGKLMSSPPLIPLQRLSHWYHLRFLPVVCASPSTASALPFGDKLQGSKLCALYYSLLAEYCVCGENTGCWELMRLGLNSSFSFLPYSGPDSNSLKAFMSFKAHIYAEETAWLETSG